MSIDAGLLLPPNEDLDELIRSLKKAGNSPAPSQDEEQQAQYFPNTHQGNSSPFVDANARETIAVVIAGDAEIIQTAPDDSPPLAPDHQGPSDALVVSASVPENTPVGARMAAPDIVAVRAAALPGATDADPIGSSASPPAAGQSVKPEIGGGRADIDAGAAPDTAHARLPAAAVIKAAAPSVATETPGVVAAVRNEAPSDITVMGGSVAENAAAGTVVAILGAVDPDAGDSFVYTLTDPSGKFEIVGNEVRVKAGATLDYETAASHDLGIKVTDAAGLSHSETLTIAVTNQNEAPTDITVAGGSVMENAAGGTVVATLGTVDPDAGDSFAYTLTDPSGKFEIVGNEVRVKAGATLDYETAASHDVGIKVTDAAGLSRSETLTIAVTNQNENADRHHGCRRVGNRECRGRHGGGNARHGGPRCRRQLCLHVDRSLGKVRNCRQRSAGQGRRHARL